MTQVTACADGHPLSRAVAPIGDDGAVAGLVIARTIEEGRTCGDHPRTRPGFGALPPACAVYEYGGAEGRAVVDCLHVNEAGHVRGGHARSVCEDADEGVIRRE